MYWQRSQYAEVVFHLIIQLETLILVSFESLCECVTLTAEVHGGLYWPIFYLQR